MEKSTRKMYVLLIRSKSLPSMIIRLFTRAGYTHASLGFSEDCMQLYSFARKYEKLPFPGKLMTEKIDRGFLGKDPKTPCALYCIEVSEEIFEKTRSDILEMYKERNKYRYNYFGLVYCLFGIAKTRKNRRQAKWPAVCFSYCQKTQKECYSENSSSLYTGKGQ